MQRSNLKVMVRPRRLPECAARGPIKLDSYGNEIELLNNLFQYDVVFDENATQEEVYEKLRSAVEKLVEGYCVGILAYGQTSSGKTYTIGTNGVEECYVRNPGIISRASSDIFRLAVPRDGTTQIRIKVTFMEIYNEQAFDLLHIDDKKKPLTRRVRDVPRKDKPGELVTDVEGLVSEEVRSTSEVMDLLQLGSRNRRVAATTMNANSSRSHAVFTIYVEHLNDAGEPTLASTPYLQLVDLAGSEVPEGDKTTIKEGVNINKSLSALGRVIIQLRDQSSYVSYRDSVLTRVLKPLLDGNSLTTLIACISMEACNEAESKKTLHYAQQARKIEITAQKAQKAVTREEFIKLKEENRRLRRICALHQLEVEPLDLTLMELEAEKRDGNPESAVKAEEMIQLVRKYEAMIKHNELLQERINHLERQMNASPTHTDFNGASKLRSSSSAEELSANNTFNLGPVGTNGEIGEGAYEKTHCLTYADCAANRSGRDELALVSALTSLDKDYDENASQLKHFIEMQKRSQALQEKVLELERQLEASEREKATTVSRLASSSKSTSSSSSSDVQDLRKQLEAQTEKNRVLQEKLMQVRRELKQSTVNSETIEKYKQKVDLINRERCKLQRMLKEQNKKNQEEMRRQKREMIALQRDQQRRAAERSRQDAKQAAERRCQQRKLEQALAAKERLEQLLKKKTENASKAGGTAGSSKLQHLGATGSHQQQRQAGDRSRMNISGGGITTGQRIKDLVEDEVSVAATRAAARFYVDDYAKQIQTYSTRIEEIERHLNCPKIDERTFIAAHRQVNGTDRIESKGHDATIDECALQVVDSEHADLERELHDLLEKRRNMQLLLDNYQVVQKDVESSGKLHERMTNLYEAQLAIMQLIAQCEKLSYQAAGCRDESLSCREQTQHMQQLLSQCEHDKQLMEEKYASLLLEMGSGSRSDRDLERLEALLKQKDEIIERLEGKLRSMAQLIPRSPFAVPDTRSGAHGRSRPLVAQRSVALRRIDELRAERPKCDTSVLFSEDEKSFSDNPNLDPDWVIKEPSKTGRVKTHQPEGGSGFQTNQVTGCDTRSTISRKQAHAEESEVVEDDASEFSQPARKKKSTADVHNGCRCSGGKSCKTCKCTKIGIVCTESCKCLARCYNGPTKENDGIQCLPNTMVDVTENVEARKLI